MCKTAVVVDDVAATWSSLWTAVAAAVVVDEERHWPEWESKTVVGAD